MLIWMLVSDEFFRSGDDVLGGDLEHVEKHFRRSGPGHTIDSQETCGADLARQTSGDRFSETAFRVVIFDNQQSACEHRAREDSCNATPLLFARSITD